MPHWDDINQWIDEAPQWSPDGKRISYRTKMDSTRALASVGVESRRLASGKKPRRFRAMWRVTAGVSRGTLIVSGTSRNRAPASTRETQEEKQHSLQSSDSSLPSHPDSHANGSKRRNRNASTGFTISSPGTNASGDTSGDRRSAGPWNSDTAPSDPNSALANYHIIEALPSPDRSKTAYLIRARYRRTIEDLGHPASGSSDHDRECRGSDPGRASCRAILVDCRRKYPVVHRTRWTRTFSGTLGIPPVRFKVRSWSTRRLVESTFPRFPPTRQERVFACLVENNTSPPQIAVIDRATKQIRTLVDLNPGFSSLEMGKAERLEGTNSYGEDWFAYLVKPLRFRAGQALSAYRDDVSKRRLFSSGSFRRRKPNPGVRRYTVLRSCRSTSDGCVTRLEEISTRSFWTGHPRGIDRRRDPTAREGGNHRSDKGWHCGIQPRRRDCRLRSESHEPVPGCLGRRRLRSVLLFSREVTNGTMFSKSGDLGDGPGQAA